ncbi:MAG: hypothetical protein ACOYKE_03105 [Ferruginibacter sp.]
MKKIISLLLLCLSMLFIGNVMAQNGKPKPVVAPKTKILNNIKLNVENFTVSDARLVFEDDSPVPANNLVELKQRVKLQLTIDKGWQQKEGRVFLGATEIIRLSDGYNVLASDDLFKSYDEEGVTPDDAQFITLYATLTELDNMKLHAIVSFRVWDKNGTGEITGSFKLFFKKAP